MNKINKKINILHISSFKNTTPPKKYGGTERLVHHLCSNLSTKGFNVLLVRLKSSRGGSYESVNIKEKSLVKKTKVLIKKFKPEVIHLHFKNEKLIRCLMESNIPVVITLYNNIRKDSAWANIIQFAPSNFFFTAISENLRNRANYFSNSKRVVTTRPCYDMSLYLKTKKVKNGKYFLYLGVIARYKSVLDIVKTFSKLKEKLFIVGPCNDKNQASYFKEILKYVENFDNIKYLGETNSENEKIQIIKNSRAVILATGYDRQERNCHEAFGLTMLEANSLGVPVVGYDHGNISDYVRHQKNGLKFRNKKELISCVNIISNTNHKWTRSCKEAAKKFNSKRVVLDYVELYKRIILDNKS